MLGSARMATPTCKSFDQKFDVVYTGVRCKDGAPWSVRAGDAERVAALNQSAAQ